MTFRLTLALTLVLAGNSFARAQDESTARARDLKNTAFEFYKQGDYESAGAYFSKAQTRQNELTALERQDLRKLIERNSTALRSRREGGIQIRQAAEALQKNRLDEANRLLKLATTNQYLSKADTDALNQLNEQVRIANRLTSPVAPVSKDGIKVDYQVLMVQAREAWKKGELDRAEQLASQAEKAYSGPPTWLQPWSDTPAKIIRDVQTSRQAKAKTPESDAQASSPLSVMRRLWNRDEPEPSKDKKGDATPPKLAAKEPADKDESTLSNIRNFIWPTKKPEPVAKTPDPAKPGVAPAALAANDKDSELDKQFRDLASLPAPQTVQVDFDPLPPATSTAVKPAALSGSNEASDPLKSSKAPELNGPDLPPAPTELDLPQLPPPPTELPPQAPVKKPAEKPTPTRVVPQTPPQSTAPPPSVSGQERVPVGLEKKALEVARALIKQGYIALRNNDLKTAQKMALEAKSLRPNLNWDEPNPDRLLADIRSAETRAPAVTTKTPEKTTPKGDNKTADARDLIRQGRASLAENKLEDAMQYCQQADAAKRRWGLFEDSPSRLHEDIQAAVRRRDRAQAESKLNQARKLFEAGELDQAQVLAWDAQKLFGPVSYWDVRRDRPDYLITEIERAKRKREPAKLPPPPDHMPPGQIATLPNGKPSAGAILKGQALALLAQAKELEKQGKYIEARDKIVQASSLQASFGPNEESPATALIQLAARCDSQVNQLLREAEAVASSKDPARFQNAAKRLADARSLSDGFGLDGKRIADKSQWLNQVAQMPVLPDVASVPPPTNDPNAAAAQRNRELGLEKMARAREKLRIGDTPGARKEFEEAYRMYGLQEALNGIRSVDIEELNQAKLSAHRNAEAGVDAATKRKDYTTARRIFGALDMRLLSPEMARLVREISALPEMQPGVAPRDVARNDQPQPPRNPDEGHVGITDEPYAQSELVDQFRALQEVRFQKMRERSLTAQRHAMELFQNKNVNKAVGVLEQHLDELAMSQLSDEQMMLIRRQVESRLQQFKTVQAQIEMTKAQVELPSQHDEPARNRKIAGMQQEVGDLMEQYRGLYKERKFKEAWVLAEKMRDLDPDNPAVTAAVHQAKYKLRLGEQAEIGERDEESVYRWGQPGNYGPFVDSNSPMHFDQEIMKRAQNRKAPNGPGSPTKTEQELAIERQLQAPISVDFQNTPLEQVIDDLHRMSGVNIVPEYKALQDHGISLKQPLQLKVEQVSLKSVLNMLLRQAELTYVVREGVLQITTEQNAKGKMVQRTYSVADLVIPVEDYPLPSVYSYEDYMRRHIASQTGQMQLPTPYMDPYSMQSGQPVSSSPGQSSQPQVGPNGLRPGNGNNWQNSKGGRLPSNTMEEQLINLITSTVAPSTWDSVGGPGHIQYYPLGAALVVNQAQDVQEQVFDLLDALRRLQDLQVAIEMRLVSVSESFFEMMGMDFDFKFLTHTRKWEPQLLTGQFQAPGYIQDFTPSNFVAGLTPAGTFTPDLDIPINQSSFGNSFPTFGGYPGLGNSGGLDIGLAFLSDIQVFMFLEAAQGDRRMNVMQAPKITVFNGQTAFITVQDQLFFLTGMTPVQTPQGPMFVAQHQAMPVGTQMQVTPVVSADRRFVRLAINQTMTNMLSATVPVLPVQVALPSIFINNSGATPEPNRVVQMFFQQPTTSVIAIQTTVNVPDGGTVLLGGLKFMAEARNESGPPVLSKIPYVNRIFKNVGWGREGATLMLMVTPRIIINEEEEMIFRGVLEPIPRP